MPIFKHRGQCFVLGSVIFHIFIMLMVFSFFKKHKEPQTLNKELEINLLEEPLVKTANTASIKEQTEPANSKKTSDKHIALKDLMPQTGFKNENIFENAQKQKALSDEIVVEDLSFYQEIWKRIDAKFYYPDIFNSLLIYGGGYVEIYIKPDGSLSRYILKVDGAHEHVEFFIKSIVVEALRSPLHEKYWHPKKEEIKLGLNFHLDLLTTPEVIDSYSKGRVNRREMYFYRKLYNPKAHVISKTLPFLGGGGMIDLVYVFNALSGRQKKIYKRNMRKLKAFKLENEKAYNGRRD